MDTCLSWCWHAGMRLVTNGPLLMFLTVGCIQQGRAGRTMLPSSLLLLIRYCKMNKNRINGMWCQNASSHSVHYCIIILSAQPLKLGGIEYVFILPGLCKKQLQGRRIEGWESFPLWNFIFLQGNKEKAPLYVFLCCYLLLDSFLPCMPSYICRQRQICI